MGLFGFGNKKEDKPYRVMHYEGIDNVGADMPCTFIIKDDTININFTSGMNITLPMARVVKFESMYKSDFMMKYKNTTAPNKQNGVQIKYLVITYMSKDNLEKRIVLWAANLRECNYFTDLHYKYQPAAGNIEL